MDIMKPNEVFLNGCNEIAKAFVEYKPIKKGQILKKYSDDKDMFFEIYFETSFRNSSAFVSIKPKMHIYSKELKNWEIEQTKNKYKEGLIYYNQIGYSSPYNSQKEWNLAGADFDKNIHEIVEDINLYIIPIVDIFKNKNTAIEYLKSNGTQFNKWTKKSLTPMAFMIYFGGKDTAEIFLRNFLEDCSYGERIKNLYNELSKIEKEKIDLNFNEFADAAKIKLAFINGIKI
jgi:hypothetical protein